MAHVFSPGSQLLTHGPKTTPGLSLQQDTGLHPHPINSPLPGTADLGLGTLISAAARCKERKRPLEQEVTPPPSAATTGRKNRAYALCQPRHATAGGRLSAPHFWELQACGALRSCSPTLKQMQTMDIAASGVLCIQQSGVLSPPTSMNRGHANVVPVRAVQASAKRFSHVGPAVLSSASHWGAWGPAAPNAWVFSALAAPGSPAAARALEASSS